MSVEGGGWMQEVGRQWSKTPSRAEGLKVCRNFYLLLEHFVFMYWLIRAFDLLQL